MKKYMKRILAFLCALALIITTVLGNSAIRLAQAADTEPTPVKLDGFDTVTVEDFQDSAGNEMESRVYANSSSETTSSFSLKEGNSFASKLLSMKVKFTNPSNREGADGMHARIVLGENGSTWTGMWVHPSLDGNNLIIAAFNGGFVHRETDITAEMADVTSFMDNQFLLQLSFKTVGSGVEVGVYVDGDLCQTYTWDDVDISTYGTYMNLYREATGTAITVDTITEATPVVLDGFDTVTVSDFQDSNGTEMESGVYANSSSETTSSFSLKEGNSFANKLLSMKVKFTNPSNREGADGMHARIVLGENGSTWTGMWVHPSLDGNNLIIAAFNGGFVHRETDITAEMADVTSFMDKQFLLQLSFKTVGSGVEVGVYVDGELCQTYTWDDVDISTYGTYMNLYREATGTSIAVEAISNETISEEPTPVVLDGFDTVTVEDFQDSNGTEMEAGEYANSSSETTSSFSLKEGNSFASKLLSLKVKFTNPSNREGADGMHARIVLGENGSTWTGMWVHPSLDGNNLIIAAFNGGFVHRETDITAEMADVTSFMDKQFLLQLSFKTVGSGVEVGVYVDGELCQTYTWDDVDISTYGTYMNLYREAEGTAITVGSINEDDDSQGPGTDGPGGEPTPGGPDTESEPVELDGFDTVTVEDFQDSAGTEMESGVYANSSSETTSSFSLKEGNSFASKLLSMKVKFTNPSNREGADGMHARIVLGENGSTWTGVWVHPSLDGNNLIIAAFNGGFVHRETDITAEMADVTSFMDNQFLLQLSFKTVGSGVEVGVYVDGELCQTYTWTDVDISTYGTYMNLYREAEGTAITVGSINEDDDSQGPGTDGPGGDTPTVYTDVTFQNFGIENDIYYSKGSNLAVEGTLEDKDDLDKIALSGDILLTGESTDTFDLMLGSKNNDVWSGIKLWINGKTMTLNLGTSTNVAILDSETAGVGSTFANNKFTLKWSVEFVCNDNDNQYNDVKVGLWFNGNLYGNEYYTISNGGTAAELGKSFAVCCESGSSSITINPDDIDDSDEGDKEPIQPNDDFTKLTFAHFGIKDNTYKYNGDLVVKGSLTELDTLDRTVLYGNVLLEGEGGYQLIFGGKEDSWDGIRFIISDANSMSLEWFGRNDVRIPITVFNSMVAGVDFVGEAYDLAVSTELIAADEDGQKNDIQFGFWFEGKLYDNSYVVVKDQGATLGNRFAAYCSGEDSTVTLNSDPKLVPKPKQPNENFEKITFEYFGAADGTYKYNGTDAPTYEGKGRDTMNEKVFCGDFLFSGVGGNQFMIGGDGNTWYGLCFIVTDDEKIALLWIDEEGAITVETYDELTAGAPLVGEWLNLMISTEIVDADGDGAEDDIQLGVWFNGALYKEAFSTILNKASGLGDCFGMYSSKEGSSISIRSIPEYIKGFDYAAFGLTKDWEKTLLGTGFKAEIATGGSRDAEPFTGDLLEVGKVCLFSAAGIAAILVGIYVMLQRKRES